MSPHQPEAAPQIALPWIVRLRYGMAIGQIATALFVRFALGVDIPLGAIAVAPILISASNLWLAARVRRSEVPRRISSSRLVAWAFVLDTLCLTYLLMLAGGPTNPFSLLYLVHITLSAIILTKQWTWLLGALSTLCFGLLFWSYRPIPALELHHSAEGTNLHLIGMWIGFGVAAVLVALFSGKISELLRQHENSLLLMQAELAKRDRLASLGTLAAGAAHELNTPLGTIAVVAREMELFATNTAPNDAVAEDSRLIRTEVDRCREILWRMSVQGAQPAAQASEPVDSHDLLDDVSREIQQPDRVEISFPDQSIALTVPRRAVAQALIALTRNALEAGPPESPVRVIARQAGERFQFVVSDQGRGMSPATLRRIGEPFFTTKEPGKGMGLGTFLVRTLAEQLGGRLTFESTPQTGTLAIFELPLTLETAPKPEAVHAD
ncbi:MAG TPA: ATP-binding protein [Bryobacteraceae bacterium]|nr:ATP-binding protein [Bryobacteraceae bacterium]